MATAMKLLLLSALLRMGAWAACDFDGESYIVGKYLTRQAGQTIGTCFQPRCNEDSIWEYTGQLDLNCGICLFGGEPLVYTFDELLNDPPGGRRRFPVVPDSNLISVDNSGEYVMTQLGIVKPAQPMPIDAPTFGVTGHFTTSDATGGPCGVHPYTNCIDGLIYYEDKLAVKLQLINGIIKVYEHNGYIKWVPVNGQTWTEVEMITGGASLPKADQTAKILVIEVPIIIEGGRDCTIVIGSKGFTVWFCKEGAYSTPGYPWAGIYAMWRLRSRNAYPTTYAPPSRPYGLCNSWTAETAVPKQNPKCFYRQDDGQCIKKWQSGITIDHQTGANIRLLDNKLAGAWEVPP